MLFSPRDVLLVDSVPPGTAGKALGFQSALDIIGATIGPAIALLLIPYMPFSQIFFVSVIPGIVCVVGTLVKDRIRGTKVVGPVGFEPTTSGPKTLVFLGTPAPQVHRAPSRSGILLAESCSQTKLSRDLSLNLF